MLMGRESTPKPLHLWGPTPASCHQSHTETVLPSCGVTALALSLVLSWSPLHVQRPRVSLSPHRAEGACRWRSRRGATVPGTRCRRRACHSSGSTSAASPVPRLWRGRAGWRVGPGEQPEGSVGQDGTGVMNMALEWFWNGAQGSSRRAFISDLCHGAGAAFSAGV